MWAHIRCRFWGLTSRGDTMEKVKPNFDFFIFFGSKGYFIFEHRVHNHKSFLVCGADATSLRFAGHPRQENVLMF